MDAAERLRRLERLAQERDVARKHILALGIVSDRLRTIGLEPILVGGAALEFYTAGGYATGDVDIALAHGPDVDAAFIEMAFEKAGRLWIRRDLDLYIDPCAPAALPGEDAPRTEVSIEGLKVAILGLEDLLIDRLRAWVHWDSEEDRRWALHLGALYVDRLDWGYVRERASGVPEEAAALGRLEADVRRIRSEDHRD